MTSPDHDSPDHNSPDHNKESDKDQIIQSLREELALTNKGIVALNLELEDKMRELELLNNELGAFAYSISHDLRQPLRAVSGFAQMLARDYPAQLDQRGQDYLTRISRGTLRMSDMIEGLLTLSRTTRKQLTTRPVALDEIAHNILSELREQHPERRVEIHIDNGMSVNADPHLMESALQNLLSNAWKYSANQPTAVISFCQDEIEGERVFVIKDNGTGFDMRYADKLFNVFQRLHTDKEFEGLGIGLATTQRVIYRHGGRIWAHSEPGQGSSFMFTLP